jgi:hypothetical protein
LFGGALLSSKRPTRSVGTGGRNIQRVDAGGLRFRIGNEAVRERGRVPKRLGLHLGVLVRHRSRDEGFLSLEYTLGVLDQQNRVKPLGPTLSSLADEWRKNPPAVIFRSVALVIPDKGLSKKKGDVADWSVAK